MKQIIFFLLLISSVEILSQDVIDIQTCYRLAEENYPVKDQKELYKEITSLELDNLTSRYFPQVNLVGQATYQSDVTKIDMEIPIPNLDIEFPEIDKDQYRIGITVDQMIWDGGIISNQKKLTELSGANNILNSEVELYQLRKRVNDIYFGVLKMQENIKILETAIEIMNAKYDQISIAVDNGMALQSNADILKAEILITEQNLDKLKDSRDIAIKSLSTLINKELTNAVLEAPEIDAQLSESQKRPEYQIFNTSKKQAKQLKELADSKYLPKFFAFGQAMYGKPGLNMFDPDFQAFYIVGIKASWNFWDWGSTSREKQIADIQTEIINTKENTFTKNLNIASVALFNEIAKYQKLLERDREIIILRENIVKTSSSQLDNGVITSTEYIAELNALIKARISYQLHLIELSEAKVNYLTHINDEF
jgi:outer membrane protein TolC